MHDFLTALGLVFVIEGCLWCLFPAGMRKAAARAAIADPGALRTAGLLSAGLGLLLVWVMRG